jgi:hypothetical protein
MAAPRDLVTMLYKPRETMRRVLDAPGSRWTNGLVALAFICASFGDPDIRHMPRELPDLTLFSTLAIVALVLIATGIVWIIAMYVISGLVTIAGRFLDGNAAVADVHAALAWSLVPMVWSIVYRIPLSIYTANLTIRSTSPWQIVVDLMSQGALAVGLIAVAIKLACTIWIMCLAAVNVSEAMKFETWKGFTAVATVAAAPIVVAAAVVLSFHH